MSHPNKFTTPAEMCRQNDGMKYDEAQLLYHLKLGLDNIDRERNVTRLKQEIEAGTYPIRGEDVAGKMLCSEHGVLVPVVGCPFCRVAEENRAAAAQAEQKALWNTTSRRWQDDFREEGGMVHRPEPLPTPTQSRARTLHVLKVALVYLMMVGMIFAVFAAQDKIKGMKQEQERIEGRR